MPRHQFGAVMSHNVGSAGTGSVYMTAVQAVRASYVAFALQTALSDFMEVPVARLWCGVVWCGEMWKDVIWCGVGGLSGVWIVWCGWNGVDGMVWIGRQSSHQAFIAGPSSHESLASAFASPQVTLTIVNGANGVAVAGWW